MTSRPQGTAATYPPGGPPPRAVAAVTPGPVPDSPVPEHTTGPGGPPAQVHENPRCVCGDGEAVHDIRGNGTRGACFVTRGPRGTRCPCKNYEAAS